DSGRLIAQVVSGIGFLGAGTIVVTKQAVKGLTTAASLWTVACLGIAIGLGFYKIGLIGFIIILLVLTVLNKIINMTTMKGLEIRFIHKVKTKEFIQLYFEEKRITVRDVNFEVQIRE